MAQKIEEAGADQRGVWREGKFTVNREGHHTASQAKPKHVIDGKSSSIVLNDRHAWASKEMTPLCVLTDRDWCGGVNIDESTRTICGCSCTRRCTAPSFLANDEFPVKVV